MMLKWKTTKRRQEELVMYMDVLEARKYFEKIKKPEYELSSKSTRYYFPHNYKRHLKSLEK